MSLLSTSLHLRGHESTLVIIQSTLATPSWIPFARAIIGAGLTRRTATIVCVCLLHAPNTVLAGMTGQDAQELVRVIDWTEKVPGYGWEEGEEDADRGGLLHEVCKAVDDGKCTFVNHE
jgi:hypothetical protein